MEKGFFDKFDQKLPNFDAKGGFSCLRLLVVGITSKICCFVRKFTDDTMTDI